MLLDIEILSLRPVLVPLDRIVVHHVFVRHEGNDPTDNRRNKNKNNFMIYIHLTLTSYNCLMWSFFFPRQGGRHAMHDGIPPHAGVGLCASAY